MGDTRRFKVAANLFFKKRLAATSVKSFQGFHATLTGEQQNIGAAQGK